MLLASFTILTPTFYSKLKILKLQDLFKFEVGKLVYSYFQNKLPQQLSNLFKLTNEISQYNTRSSHKSRNYLYIPRYHTQHLQKSIKYQGVKIWNDIPPEIQNSSGNLLKSRFKFFLLSQYN